MKIISIKSTSLLAACALAFSLAPAQAGEEKSKASMDQTFVRKATQGGMTEVKLGELASKQGESADVKEFGSMMVMDHSKLGADLKAAAEKDGLKVPVKLGAKNQEKVDEMAKLKGAEFDKAYVPAMVKAHEMDSAEFTKASETLVSADVKAAATTAVPVINSHLEKIKAIQAKMK